MGGNDMKALATLIAILIIALQPLPASAGFEGFLKNIKEALPGGGISNTKIIDGLKEALQIGAGNAVTTLSQTNGYASNPEVRIPLPGAVEKLRKVFKLAGYGALVDEFEMSMNRAAEHAAPKAKSVFADAITQMNFTDAKKILDGRDNEATLYFQDKTSAQLAEILQPLINDSMSTVGATQQFQTLNNKLGSIPFADKMIFDLDQYVTDKALAGLFFMLAEEERKIRQNPAARVTDLLKDVFGKR
jgi:hypothetical protein